MKDVTFNISRHVYVLRSTVLSRFWLRQQVVCVHELWFRPHILFFSVIHWSSHIFQEASKWVASARNLSCFSASKIFYCLTRKCCASMFLGFPGSWFKGKSSSNQLNEIFFSLQLFLCIINLCSLCSISSSCFLKNFSLSAHTWCMTSAHMLVLAQISGLALLIFNSNTPNW